MSAHLRSGRGQLGLYIICTSPALYCILLCPACQYAQPRGHGLAHVQYRRLGIGICFKPLSFGQSRCYFVPFGFLPPHVHIEPFGVPLQRAGEELVLQHREQPLPLLAVSCSAPNIFTYRMAVLQPLGLTDTQVSICSFLPWEVRDQEV